MKPLARLRAYGATRAGQRGHNNERDFLPAALEILETPPSPAGRSILWLIIAFFVSTLVWSALSSVDVVAVGHGKIIPSGKVKTVQPLEGGIVREILVEDGQRVSQGDVLIRLDAAVSQADVNAVGQRIKKLEETLPLIVERARSLKDLSKKGYVPRNDFLAIEEQRISMSRDLASLRYEHAKMRQRTGWQTLTAPVSGVVQQLAVHTIGGVVTPAESLMTIVPDGATLEVEAFIENKDIGFIWAGQPVRLKIETFPFTKYGTIDGVLTNVSDDAVQHDQLGLVYTVRSSMARSVMDVDGRLVKLTPGMSITAEIQIGKRRVIEYFLSPLLRRSSESVRER